MLDFLTVQTISSNPTLITVIYTVILSFVLSVVIAFTYERTFRGLSYSRNYLQAIVLSSIVAATVMQAIGDSLARGLGMIGALAIIRFRTVFKDPRDIIFIFASLAAGISCGVYGYSVGVVGTLAFCIAAFLLYYSPIGRTRNFDGILRFNIKNRTEETKKLEEILKKHCRVFALITLREASQGSRLDYAYHVKLKESASTNEVVNDIKALETTEGVSLMLQETTTEV